MRPAVALAALLLSGCGGGGGADSTTSAPPAAAAADQPPAATAPPPAEAPRPAPAARAAAPTPAPATEGPAKPLAPPPQPAGEPGGPNFVSGEQVTSALATFYGWTGDDPRATGQGAAGRVIVSQRVTFGPPDQQPSRYTYVQQSSGEAVPLVQIGNYFIDGALGPVLSNSAGVDLYRAEPFDARGKTWALDQNMTEWRSADGNWFARLLLQSEGSTRYRVCWLLALPNVSRLVCSKHDKASGAHVGVHVVDEAQGSGTRTWATP